MSPKRGDRVGPPGWGTEWDVRFLNGEAAKGWEELCCQAPGNTLQAWQVMRHDPLPSGRNPRHHPMHDHLAEGKVKGRTLPRWQIEVTGAGRIWYLADEDRRTVWVEYAGPGHPKATDR